MRKDLDSSPLDGNDPGGRGGVTGGSNEIGIVRRADQTEHENTENVEQQDTDPDTTDSAGNVFGRIVGFRGRDSDDLGAQESISSANQDGPNAGKATQSSRNVVVLNERTGIVLHHMNLVIHQAGQ